MIVGPKQMRCHAAPRPPGLGDLGERLGVRAFAQTKSKACRFLHSQVARRKRIRMSKAKEKINIGGPWPDPMQARERGVGLIGVHIAHGSQIDSALGNRFADFANRFDLRGGYPKTPELVGTRAADGVVVKWIEGSE